jgi:hypothetical protein
MKSEQVYHQLRKSCLKAKEKGLKFKNRNYLYFNEATIDESPENIVGCCALGSFIINNFDQYMNYKFHTEKFLSEKLSISEANISAIARGFDNLGIDYENYVEFYNVGQKLRKEFLEI